MFAAVLMGIATWRVVDGEKIVGIVVRLFLSNGVAARICNWDGDPASD